MKKVVNMTPHDVILITSDGKKVFPSEGIVRVQQEITSCEALTREIGLPISHSKFGEVTGLPEEKSGTYYIVSQMVKSALPSRSDLLVPTQMVRDEQGRIVGCQSFGV